MLLKKVCFTTYHFSNAEGPPESSGYLYNGLKALSAGEQKVGVPSLKVELLQRQIAQEGMKEESGREGK